MNMHRLTLLPLLGLLLAVGAGANPARSRFEWAAPIDATFQAGEQGRLVVPGDVFGQARSFPNDLRIFGADGTQWPFFLHIAKQQADTQVIGVDILNRSWVAGAEPYLQFDLAVPVVDGESPVHNRLELETTGHDFVRRVEIFAGDPGQATGHMASGYLIDFSRQRDARNRLVRYPDSDVERLHVRIYPNAQDAGETFGIRSVRIQHRAIVEVEREEIGFIDVEVGEREQQSGAQTRILDLGHANRPVEFITFDVADPSFARCVSVYGRNSEHDPWQWVGGGEIHALPGDRENTIQLRARHRFLKVQAFHYDDLPLDIEALRLEAIPRHLVFEAASAGQADLCFRAWDIKAPRYDLQSRIKTEDIAALPVFHVQETIPNDEARTQPWRKYSKLLGGLAVGVVSLLVLWIIVSMLRQQSHTEGEE